jgi:transposase InsO family protein
VQKAIATTTPVRKAIHGEVFAARQTMKETVFEYIEVDYKRTRRHSTNGYLSPELFEALQVA